jgi:hypothetical protein
VDLHSCMFGVCLLALRFGRNCFPGSCTAGLLHCVHEGSRFCVNSSLDLGMIVSKPAPGLEFKAHGITNPVEMGCVKEIATLARV